MQRRLIASVVAPASLAALLPLAPAAAAPRTHLIVMADMKFGPAPAQLRPGDTIVWDNRDMFRHTATARDGSFNVDLPPGAKARTTFRKSGNVAFFCKYHPGMRGTLRIGLR